MRIEQCFDKNELGRLLPKLGEVKDTVWRTLSLQGFEPPTASIVSRILFLVSMVLKPFQALWTVCFHLIFPVEPGDNIVRKMGVGWGVGLVCGFLAVFRSRSVAVLLGGL